jgi:hypothetical protein
MTKRFMAHNVHFPHVPYLLVPAPFRPVLACHDRHRLQTHLIRDRWAMAHRSIITLLSSYKRRSNGV